MVVHRVKESWSESYRYNVIIHVLDTLIGGTNALGVWHSEYWCYYQAALGKLVKSEYISREHILNTAQKWWAIDTGEMAIACGNDRSSQLVQIKLFAAATNWYGNRD